MPVPERLSWTEAGGTPEVFTTAHDAVFTQGGLLVGERLLVHGGAGGVGTAAIQLGRVAGARVTATVRNPEARELVAQLGATVIEPDGFAEHGPFDLILELVGAINLADNVKSIDFNGRISIIGTSAGAVGELNLGLLMHKRARIYGSTLRARPLEQKAMTARAVERSVLPALAAARSPFRSPRRSRSRTRSRPTTGSRPAASSARSCCCPTRRSGPASGAAGLGQVGHDGARRAQAPRGSARYAAARPQPGHAPRDSATRRAQ